MARSLRFRRMESPTQTLMIVAACGSVVAAGFGAMAGAGLRVPPRIEPETPRFIAEPQEVFLASAPAYPSWAPEPLYPRAERDPVAEFAAAWDAAMSDARNQPRPAAYHPPVDLPPAYEVRLEGEARPISDRPRPRPLGPAPRPAPAQPQAVVMPRDGKVAPEGPALTQLTPQASSSMSQYR